MMDKLLVAIPTADGLICPHFGHCSEFTLIQVENELITGTSTVKPPPHEPGVLPRWLHDLGVNKVIAGGMGHRAQSLFREKGIEVVVGAVSGAPRKAVQQYLDGRLETGKNLCDH